MHIMLQSQDIVPLASGLCLVQATAPNCSALPSLRLMNSLSPLEAQLRSHLLPEASTTLRQS